jgi:hypothetical protein
MNYLLRSIFFIAFLIGANSIAFSQSKDVKDIIALMRTEEEVWNRGDIDAYVNLYALGDSTRMIYNGGVGVTRGQRQYSCFL